MNPILIDLPVPIKTSRLLLRPPQAGDGKALNTAILESFEQLSQWLPWAVIISQLEEKFHVIAS